jgi:hypothetical protein
VELKNAFGLQRHMLLIAYKLIVHADSQAADVDRVAGQAIWLASACWGTQSQTTVTSDRRLRLFPERQIIWTLDRGETLDSDLKIKHTCIRALLQVSSPRETEKDSVQEQSFTLHECA